MTDDPQAAGERRAAARYLVQHPLVTLERDPDRFRLVRRHQVELDRWFTQRLGYRLHVDGDTARLFKSGYIPDHRPLRTGTGRAFRRREYVLLALVLAATAAGPDVISLRDLVDQVRSAAAECGITLRDDRAERGALVVALDWMIGRGLAVELHAQVDAYAADGEADAVLKLRPDRIVLLALPALAGAADADALLAQAERRTATRQWMRSRLVEDPVVYRDDLTDAEWNELRRRLGDEAGFLDEMLGLVLEARAEGVAAVDPTGSLTDVRFPTSGTVGHAALLLLDELAGGATDRSDDQAAGRFRTDELLTVVERLVTEHRSHWSQQADDPTGLLDEVLDLLERLRLVERHGSAPAVTVRPAAARFSTDRTATRPAGDPTDGPDEEQASLW